MTTAAGKQNGIGKYVVIYICILAIAALQFVVAYSNITPSQMFARTLFLAIIEAALALLFFMHLSHNRGLLGFVVIFTVFVLLTLQYGWTDSFRLSGGIPWAR